MADPTAYHARFRAYLDGELSAQEASALEDQLLVDEALSDAFEAFARGSEATLRASSTDTPAPPDGFTASVRERIRRRSGGRFFDEDRVSSRFIPVFIVVSFLILVVFAIAGRWASPGGLFGRAVDDAVIEDAADMPADPAARPRLNPTGTRSHAEPVYTRLVLEYVVKQPKDAVHAALVERFGEERVESRDDVIVVRVGSAGLAEGIDRVKTLEGRMRERSREVTEEDFHDELIYVLSEP